MLKSHHLYFDQLKPYLPENIIQRHERTTHAVTERLQKFPQQLLTTAMSYIKCPSLIISNLVPFFATRSPDQNRVDQVTASTCLFIMAANMQDDLLDQERRADIRGVYQPKMLLTSDLCIFNAYGILSSEAPALVESVNSYLNTAINGELEDLSEDISVDSATQSLLEKSGGLGQLCGSAGAALADENYEEIRIAGKYGLHLVSCLQYLDDFLDLREDLKSGRKTPLVLSIRRSNTGDDSQFAMAALVFTRKSMEFHLHQCLEILSKSQVYQNVDALRELPQLILGLFDWKAKEVY